MDGQSDITPGQAGSTFCPELGVAIRNTCAAAEVLRIVVDEVLTSHHPAAPAGLDGQLALLLDKITVSGLQHSAAQVVTCTLEASRAYCDAAQRTVQDT